MKVLRKDLGRTWELTSGNGLLRCLTVARAPGVQAVIVYRFGQWARERLWLFRVLLDPAYLVLNFLIQVLWGIELPRGARIGAGLYIGHFGGITVSPHAVIGARCNLSQNTTIGVSGQGGERGVPVIGDDVYIAPGARIFGKIRVGSGVKIGANAVVHDDIPDGSVVVLDPGFRILSRKPERVPRVVQAR